MKKVDCPDCVINIRRFAPTAGCSSNLIMRMHTPTISVKEIIRCLESRHPNLTGIVKRSTLQRHLFEEGFGRRTLLQEREQNGRAFFGRYRKSRFREM